VAWLEHHLQHYAGTVIAVTHDRFFLDNVAGWILELDRGQGIPWKGNYSSLLENKQLRLKQTEKTESERQKTLQRELVWIAMSPKGRHAKSTAGTGRGKAGEGDFEALQNGVSQIRAYIFSECYHIEKAVAYASRSAYPAKLIETGAKNFVRFENAIRSSIGKL